MAGSGAGAGGGILNASTWSGGIGSWSGSNSAGPCCNTAVSFSWTKDTSEQRRYSSENSASECSSSSSSGSSFASGSSSSSSGSSTSSGSCSSSCSASRLCFGSSRSSGRSSSSSAGSCCRRSGKQYYYYYGSVLSRGGGGGGGGGGGRILNLASSSSSSPQSLGSSCGISRRIPLHHQGTAAEFSLVASTLSSSSCSGICLEQQTRIQLEKNWSSGVCHGGIVAIFKRAMALERARIVMKQGSALLNRVKNKTDRDRYRYRRSVVSVRALGRSGGQDRGEETKEMRETLDMQALEGKWHAELSRASAVPDQAEASWEQMGMVFRVVYAIAMYGGLAFAGSVICNFTGVDLWGGFDLSPEVITSGFGYAVPPMMVLLFILEDETVKNCGPARAIRDVEDEELMDFFVGMSPWQFPFVVAAGAVAEELFFRVSIQGGLAHAFQVSDKGMSETTIGLASLTGVIPMFVPFAHLFAAVLTAALTGSMYYVISSPKDPKYVVAPAIRGPKNRRDIKARVEAWYARRQQKKIYSPLVESLLALYLGLEWMHTGNILAPIITHTLYSLVIVGNGLRRIHDNREKLRQRVNKIAGQQLTSLQGRESGP